MASAGMLGALGGLGEGLMQFGKQYMANQLELDREQRQEAKALKKIDPQMDRFYEKDGVLFKQSRNSRGDVIEDSLASVDEIEKRNLAKQKQENDNLESRMRRDKYALDVAKGEQELANYADDRELDRRYREAQISNLNDRSEAAMINALRPRGGGGGSNSATTSGEGKTEYDYVNLLSKDTTAKAELKKYEAEIPAGEEAEIMQEAVRQAARYGMDPRTVLREILFERYGVAQRQRSREEQGLPSLLPKSTK